MLTWYRGSPTVRDVPSSSRWFGVTSYAASVAPIRQTLSGCEGISGEDICHQEYYAARSAGPYAHTGSSECSVLGPGRLSPGKTSGRQVIRAGSGTEVIHLSASNRDGHDWSVPDGLAVFTSADDGPPPLGRLQATSDRKVMDE